MDKLAEFISQHMSDDTARLILDRAKWPEIDMDLAVSCIESRRKLKGKVKEWYENPDLIFPAKLSAEQCSSSATATYKADLARSIASRCGKESWTIADLTGGLGVDSWFFSKKADKVLYNEMQEALCNAAIRNFRTLGCQNISVSCMKAESGRTGVLLDGFSPDIVFMDPARRGEGGRKVFLLEDCSPDVLTLKDEIFHHCRNMLLKLSPMADISMVCERLGKQCREVHVVAAGGECKELLIWMDREWEGEYTVSAVELPGDYPETEAVALCLSSSSEKSAVPSASSSGSYLFEPGKALMKAGAFNTVSEHFGIGKLGSSTHYYLTDDEEKARMLMRYGKVFKVLESHPLDKRSMKDAGKRFPKADVTARNIPMTSEMLRKKIGCSSGEGVHLFGLRSDKEGALLLITDRMI